MKEKTFEEMIIQLFPNHKLTKDRWSFELIQFSADDLIEFGKKVREATIEECKNIPLKWTDLYYDENNRDMVSEPEVNIEAFDNLPTDRIKI